MMWIDKQTTLRGMQHRVKSLRGDIEPTAGHRVVDTVYLVGFDFRVAPRQLIGHDRRFVNLEISKAAIGHRQADDALRARPANRTDALQQGAQCLVINLVLPLSRSRSGSACLRLDHFLPDLLLSHRQESTTQASMKSITG